jgi:hypothetical protein
MHEQANINTNAYATCFTLKTFERIRPSSFDLRPLDVHRIRWVKREPNLLHFSQNSISPHSRQRGLQ